MNKDEALGYIENGFRVGVDEEDEEAWWDPKDGDDFKSLLVQLVDDHDVPIDAAVDILETAWRAMRNEYGD